MAKLPKEVKETIWLLKRQSLDIVEEASATEFILFDLFGETEHTISYLDEMQNVAEDATSLSSRLSSIYLKIVQSQPQASADLLRLLYKTIEITQTRIPPWERSIQEVKNEWNLS